MECLKEPSMGRLENLKNLIKERWSIIWECVLLRINRNLIPTKKV